MTEDEEPETLEEAAREELHLLWGDLRDAVNRAINGVWSIDCGHVEHRIKMLTQFVGATPWEMVPLPLLEGGIYQRIHAEMGVEADVDMVRVAETRRSIEARLRSLSPQGRP